MVPHRNLRITWKPISLLFKNDPPEGAYREAVQITHGFLRVMESLRAAADTPEDGNHDVFKLYWELGARIHHDGRRDFDIRDALKTVDLDVSHADAEHDPIWDPVIRAGMDEGLRLTGNDVGTPIIATTTDRGVRVGYFGPVITKVPTGEDSLTLWDSLYAMMGIDGFFELKRTRTEAPDPGDRPDPV